MPENSCGHPKKLADMQQPFGFHKQAEGKLQDVDVVKVRGFLPTGCFRRPQGRYQNRRNSFEVKIRSWRKTSREHPSEVTQEPNQGAPSLPTARAENPHNTSLIGRSLSLLWTFPFFSRNGVTSALPLGVECGEWGRQLIPP